MSAHARFVEVIPLCRLPRPMTVFDYAVPAGLTDPIQIGSIVFIPFRGRRLPAIVSSLKSESTYTQKELKEIERVVDSQPLLDAKTLVVLRSCAHACGVSAATFLHAALPDIPKRALPEFIVAPKPRPRGFTVPHSWIPRMNSALSAIHQSPSVVFHIDEPRLFTAILARLALEAFEHNRHVRILSTNPGTVYTLAHTFNQHGIPTIRILPRDAMTAQYRTWRSVAHGSVPVLIGTRNAVFLPLPPNSTVVLLDDELDEWKQEEGGPRFDVRSIAEQLSAAHNARFLRATTLPRPEIFFQAKNNAALLHDIRLNPTPSPTVLDMDVHMRSGNREPISDALIEQITAAQKSILFVQRKGSAAVLLCADCSSRFRCPDCDALFTVHHTSLRCPTCERREPIPAACPSCHGIHLKKYGTGTERVEETMKALFPERRVLRIDQEAASVADSLSSDVRSGEWDILIGTQALLPLLAPWGSDPMKTQLVAIADADGMLHRNDFRSQEKLGRIVARLGCFAAQQNAPFTVQTAFPDLPVWQALSSPAVFLEHELRERKALQYPPFIRLVKFVVQSPSAEKSIEDSQALHRALKIAYQEIPCTISEPYAATPNRVRNRYHTIILLRFDPRYTESITSYFSSLPDSVFVDLDPIDILR
ncbi:MAG: primosomal protein N' [bacterium]|nr:primosomal protein N' [bacterium]